MRLNVNVCHVLFAKVQFFKQFAKARCIFPTLFVDNILKKYGAKTKQSLSISQDSYCNSII